VDSRAIVDRRVVSHHQKVPVVQRADLTETGHRVW
jgi:hypothetical protein